ncbi:cytochrome P450 [Streptomyces sp. NPDC003042]
MFSHQDGSEHLDYRRLIAREFSVLRTRRLAVRIGRMAEKRIDAMTAAGDRADLVAEYALPLCSEALCDVLGIAWTKTTSAEILRLFTGQDLSNHDLYETGTPVDDFALDLARQIIKEPGRRPGLLARIAGRQVPGGRIGEAELAGVAKLVLLAGHVSPTHMLALSALTLIEDQREWYSALGQDPACATAVVEELLRHITIKQFGLIRRATRDTEVAGVQIREGDWVVCSLKAGEDNQLGQPVDFDPAGHAGGHLSFGHGPHQCLGQSLSRVVLEEGLVALSRRLPGLRLAGPEHALPFRDDKTVYGVKRLPVAW